MNFRVFLGLFFSVLLVPSQLLATEGVVIEPAIQKIYLDTAGVPQEPVQTVTIQNTTPLELTFTLRAIEFTDLDKSGGNIFLGQSLSAGNFMEATWVEIPETQILLIPGEKKTIAFQLREPERLLPGAHYGAILFETVRPAEREGEDPQKIFLRQIATSLLYVSKDTSQQKMSVGEVKRYHTFPKLVESLVVTFVNEGSSFVEPRGFVEVHNVLGQSVGKRIVNESGKLVVPGQEREVEVAFTNAHYFLPGPYKFDISYRTGDEAYQQKSVTFWYWEPLLLLTGLLAALFIITFAFHKSKKSKRVEESV